MLGNDSLSPSGLMRGGGGNKAHDSMSPHPYYNSNIYSNQKKQSDFNSLSSAMAVQTNQTTEAHKAGNQESAFRKYRSLQSSTLQSANKAVKHGSRVREVSDKKRAFITSGAKQQAAAKKLNSRENSIASIARTNSESRSRSSFSPKPNQVSSKSNIYKRSGSNEMKHSQTSRSNSRNTLVTVREASR